MTTTYKINDRVYLPAKHPSTTRAYTVNLASEDGTNDASTSDTGFLQARTISSISVTTPSGITLSSSANDTKTLTLNVAAGTNNTDYEFDIAVTLSTGKIEYITVIVPVRDPGSN